MSSRVLNTAQIDVEHSAINLAEHLKLVLNEWKIPDKKVVAIITDNGANIVKAIKEFTTFRHIPYFAHTSNLVVKNSIDANDYVSELLDKCRGIVSYFKKSTTGTSKLKQLSQSSQKKLKPDVKTRWNSTLFMLRSLLDLKQPVDDALTLLKPESKLNVIEWDEVAELVFLLSPFDEITTNLSSQHYPSVSKVIPAVRLMEQTLQDVIPTFASVDRLKKDILSGWSSRFQGLEDVTPLLLSTYLDPR